MNVVHNGNNDYRFISGRFLEPLVDGVVVKGAIIADFREGVLMYWPSEIDPKILSFAENIYIPFIDLGYIVINSLDYPSKFLIIQFGERILLLVIDKRVKGEELGGKLLRSFRLLCLGNKY